MKKIISKCLAVVLSVALLSSIGIVSNAEENSSLPQAEWVDVDLSKSEFDQIISQNENNPVSPKTSGLIINYSIATAKSGSKLIIAGETVCGLSVVKCGFSVVKVQRRANSSSSWTTYKAYEDLYVNDSSYLLTKSLTVPSGYQYRVTCTHYAKKNILSTEKINNTSNTVTF